jgi:hypothetical protein
MRSAEISGQREPGEKVVEMGEGKAKRGRAAAVQESKLRGGDVVDRSVCGSEARQDCLRDMDASDVEAAASDKR